MKTFISPSSWKSTAALVLVLLLSNKLVHCQDEEGGGGGGEEEPERTCQQSLFRLMRQVITVMPKCLGSNNRIGLKFRRPMEPLSRAYCIVKCLLSELEVLDEVGHLDEVNALFFFQDNIPEHVLPAVVEVAGPCLEMAGTLIPEQYYCQSYGPFTQCLVRAFLLGLGPWALDCFGSPTFAGAFGFLAYFVPPITPATAGASRRIITPSANTTLLIKRMKELRKQRRLSMPNVLNNSSSHNYPGSSPPPIVTATTPGSLLPSLTNANSYNHTVNPSQTKFETVNDSLQVTAEPRYNMSTLANFTEHDMQLLITLGEQMGMLLRPM